MKKQSCTIWRASLNGECKQIAESEATLWYELEHDNFWFEGTTRDQWVVTSSDEDLPVIHGSSPDGGEHISWDCPLCGQTHDTDREESASPQIWFCENGEGIALVEWDTIEPVNPHNGVTAVCG